MIFAVKVGKGFSLSMTWGLFALVSMQDDRSSVSLVHFRFMDVQSTSKDEGQKISREDDGCRKLKYYLVDSVHGLHEIYELSLGMQRVT